MTNTLSEYFIPPHGTTADARDHNPQKRWKRFLDPHGTLGKLESEYTHVTESMASKTAERFPQQAPLAVVAPSISLKITFYDTKKTTSK